jgi:predicted nucleotidyltransferase
VERSRAWWHDRSRAFLSECARLVASRVGDDASEAVFLCGSFAADDESVVLETDPPVLLSDVDLVVIVKSLETLLEWGGRRAELGAACEDLWRDIRFSGRVDVGVMLARDLGAMPARPGVYDMRSRGRVLAGDPTILDRIPAYAPADITAREAVVLVENRGVSLLDARPGTRRGGEAEPYSFLYRIARVYTDIAAATLSIAGAYVPGYAARAALVRKMARAGSGDPVPGLAGGALVDRIERWTAFKLEPSLAAAGADREARAFDAMWGEAAADLVEFWKRARSVERDPAREGGSGAGVPARRAQGRGTRRDNLRAWKSYLSNAGASKRLSLVAALGNTLLVRTPFDVVREEGMRLLDHRVALGAASPVRAPRGGFPHHGGDWDRAAGEICAAWNGFVFGRAGG